MDGDGAGGEVEMVARNGGIKDVLMVMVEVEKGSNCNSGGGSGGEGES